MQKSFSKLWDIGFTKSPVLKCRSFLVIAVLNVVIVSADVVVVVIVVIVVVVFVVVVVQESRMTRQPELKRKKAKETLLTRYNLCFRLKLLSRCCWCCCCCCCCCCCRCYGCCCWSTHNSSKKMRDKNNGVSETLLKNTLKDEKEIVTGFARRTTPRLAI